MTCSNIVWSNWNQTIYRHRYAYQIAAYRTQANKDRSRLVASPPSNHTKTHFSSVLCVKIWEPKQEFLNSARALYWLRVLYSTKSFLFKPNWWLSYWHFFCLDSNYVFWDKLWKKLDDMIFWNYSPLSNKIALFPSTLLGH